MQTYHVTVRVKSPDSAAWIHELPKSDVTAAEIMVLRAIHGNEGVANIRPAKMDKRERAGEVERLRINYGDAVVRHVFGPQPSSMLPVKLEDVQASEEESA